MKRRDFLPLLGAAAAVWPAAVRAQQTGRRPVVALALGTVPLADMIGPDPAYFVPRILVHRLRDLGWIEGRTVVIERRSAEGKPERAPAILAELVARGVDVIFVGATSWMLEAAQRATRTVPTIAIFTEDPIAAGLVASLARPGGNLIGVTTVPGRALMEKRLELLKELAPGINRVAFLGRRSSWEAYNGEAGAAGLPSVFALVERPEQFEEGFATVVRDRADALMVSHGPVLYEGTRRIIDFAAERRLPAVFPWREAVEAGGLMSYGPNIQGVYRQAAALADRILKGAKSAELPIEQPATFELAINLKTAKALGLTVSPTLLARAEQVIE